MSVLPQHAWLERAAALEREHAQVSHGAEPPRAALARALVDLLDLAMVAPRALRDGLRSFDEDMLTKAAEARGDRIRDEGTVAWPSRSDDPQAVFDALALQVRSLDEALQQDSTRPPSDALLFEDFCRVVRDPGEGGDRFLVKRVRPRPGVTLAQHHPYALRALRWHRLLPTRLNGMPVRLHHKTTLSPPAPPSQTSPFAQTLGAALFEGFGLARPLYEDIGAGPFRIEAIDCTAPEGTVVAQVAAASREGCFALVWPELCVTPELREEIAAALVAQDDPPQIVVAGSWHEERDGAVANTAHVLDGRGTPLLRYDKVIPYSDSKGCVEDIRRGDCVPVLVTDEALVAFAICRDFCDVQEPLPNLDVDLVLVPSLSGEKALPGHIANAVRLVGTHRTRSFVVQQALPAVADGLGWVLDVQRLPEAPGEPSPVAQTVTFTAYRRQT
ncbi:hypothetical protein [Salinarimonas rosea]|uniref:hypothetical protein n=1 Tax=Salinarimonas rosea TaxID=552063 RepID=UPI0003F6502C|nr:hypothetical protein [Salinarimonas rosea]